jgi:predicted nuclease of predicted toxin-antitoxin system
VKLLLDQNISYKILDQIIDLYPNSNHVRLLGMETAVDTEIWNFAKKNNFIIVTFDSDFYERGLIFGFPPKILWIRTGNISSKYIINILVNNFNSINDFYSDKNKSCLNLY